MRYKLEHDLPPSSSTVTFVPENLGGNMQIDCKELDIRDDGGKVLVESIVVLILGDEEQDDDGFVFRGIIISLSDFSSMKVGQTITVWNKNESQAVYKFMVERAQYDFRRQAHKLEGRVFMQFPK